MCKMKFILTIDTEGDNQWDHGRILSTENIRYVPRVQKQCNEFSIKPTYLLTSDICEDAYAQSLFRGFLESNQAEVGAHLHSWTTPPYYDRIGLKHNDYHHAFASELPVELLNEKLKNLTLQIESAFGAKPRAFRSGRFGFNENVARSLVENGYLVDTSVTPFTSWRGMPGIQDGAGGPDFLSQRPRPFKYEFSTGSLVEIPVTVLPTRFPLNINHKIAERYFRNVGNHLFLRAIRKVFYRFQPLWLSPYNWMDINLLKEVVEEAERLNLPYLVMIFHSSEVMPGCSIYRPTIDSIEELYNLLNDFFTLLKDKGIASSTLTEAAIEFIK